RQILRVEQFADPAKGITVNAGVITGGTRANVVAPEAVAQIDVRVSRLRDVAALEERFQRLRPVDRRTKLRVSGGFNRPPLERSAHVAALFNRARRLAGSIGIQLDEAAVGGGSDGNFTAALSIPTLDGLGCTGGGAHAASEHIVIRELPQRT